MLKVNVINLGCKVNQCESDGLIRELKTYGFEVGSELTCADIYALNTCAVTGEAERKSRQSVSKCIKQNKNAAIFVIGCASQNNGEQFSTKNNVTYVNGAQNKAELAQKIAEYAQNISNFKKEIKCDDIEEYQEISMGECARARYYVKIQDGCNNFCSYCIVPYLRGRSRSRDIGNVVSECEKAQTTTNEIVLTGINLSAYGEDIGATLGVLIGKLSHIDCAIRLGSLEVNVITEEFLLATKKLKNFCPHFHLSLQSAANKVLHDMNRKYKISEYLAKVELIRKYYPDCAITTDIIVGFPTETEEDFLEGIKNIEIIRFADAHIFPYSKREGTLASKYRQINGKIIEERIDKLNTVIHLSRTNYLASNANRTHLVIAEQVEKVVDGVNYYGGYTENYLRTIFTGQNVEIGEKYMVEVTKIDDKNLLGRVVSKA